MATMFRKEKLNSKVYFLSLTNPRREHKNILTDRNKRRKKPRCIQIN